MSQRITKTDIETYKRANNFNDVWVARQKVPSLSQILRYQGEDRTEKTLYRIINDFNKLLSDAVKLDPEHIRYLAQELPRTYPRYQLTEIALVLKNGIRGEYGSTYGELDVLKVMLWFKMYNDQRWRLIEVKRSDQDNKRKALKPTPGGLELVKKLTDRLEEDKRDLKNTEDPPRPKLRYNNWEHYCYANGKDPERVIGRLNAYLLKRYQEDQPDLDKGIYIEYCKQMILNRLNKRAK